MPENYVGKRPLTAEEQQRAQHFTTLLAPAIGRPWRGPEASPIQPIALYDYLFFLTLLITGYYQTGQDPYEGVNTPRIAQGAAYLRERNEGLDLESLPVREAVQWLVRQIAGAAKVERIYSITQLLGLVFGALRGVWWSFVFLIALISSGLPYMIESAEQRSLAAPRMIPTARQVVESVAGQYPGAGNRHNSLIPGIVVEKKQSKGR